MISKNILKLILLDAYFKKFPRNRPRIQRLKPISAFTESSVLMECEEPIPEKTENEIIAALFSITAKYGVLKTHEHPADPEFTLKLKSEWRPVFETLKKYAFKTASDFSQVPTRFGHFGVIRCSCAVNGYNIWTDFSVDYMPYSYDELLFSDRFVRKINGERYVGAVRPFDFGFDGK